MENKPNRLKGFTQKAATVMHVDLNSCFATIEQQANPKLRGLPIVVAAYPTNGGCILAPSIEAKRLGIKTGMRVGEARQIFPGVKVLTPDPPKYRFVHQKMMEIFRSYSPWVTPRSIDEAVLEFKEQIRSPQLRESELRPQGRLPEFSRPDLFGVGQKIKRRIKQEVGEHLTVSIGLAPNRFLAKTAAGLKKPDGLEEINSTNIVSQLSKLQLIDLCGINQAYESRLNEGGIFTTLDFLGADRWKLRSIFKSVNADYWYQRLRGFEVDDFKSERKSIGHSYALPRATLDLSTLRPILYRLCEKTGRRLRANGYQAQGICLGLRFKGGGGFQQGQKLPQPIYASEDIFREGFEILRRGLDPLQGPNPNRSPVVTLSLSVFRLIRSHFRPINFLEDEVEKEKLTKALDIINDRFGEFTIFPGELLGLERRILDRIAFGGIRDI